MAQKKDFSVYEICALMAGEECPADELGSLDEYDEGIADATMMLQDAIDRKQTTPNQVQAIEEEISWLRGFIPE